MAIITLIERSQIELMQHHTIQYIAATLGRSRISIRHELHRCPEGDYSGSQHFFGQFAKRLFVKLGHTRKAMLLVQDSLSVLVPLRGCKRSRCKRRLALSDH